MPSRAISGTGQDGNDRVIFSLRQGREFQIRIGNEYLKKLFQVPYGRCYLLNWMSCWTACTRRPRLEPDQIEDLRSRTLPYLRYVAGDERINPREIKRFVNTYTLQTLVRPELDGRIVLALQTIAFHPEWQPAYDMIMADWPSFRAALERYRTRNGEILGFVWARGTAVPSDFLRYAGSAPDKSIRGTGLRR